MHGEKKQEGGMLRKIVKYLRPASLILLSGQMFQGFSRFH